MLLVASVATQAQSYRVVNHFYFNPALYNPAFVANSGYFEIYTFHRRQVLGIEDAPTYSGLSVQYPTRKRINLGASFDFLEVVGVRQYNGEASIGYRLPLGANQSFTFALAGGIVGNDLTPELLNENDPAVFNVVDLNTSLTGRFGIVYSFKNFTAGFALPQLFAQNAFSEQQFDGVEVSELDNRIYSLSYYHALGGTGISLKPYVVYKELDVLSDQYEGGVIGYYKDQLWLGGSYHSNNGVAAYFGAKIKNIASVSYSYEFGNNDLSALSNGSHEIHLAFNLGKRRNKLAKASEEVLDTNVAAVPDESTDLYPIVDKPKDEESDVSDKDNKEKTNSKTSTSTAKLAEEETKEPDQDQAKNDTKDVENRTETIKAETKQPVVKESDKTTDLTDTKPNMDKASEGDSFKDNSSEQVTSVNNESLKEEVEHDVTQGEAPNNDKDEIPVFEEITKLNNPSGEKNLGRDAYGMKKGSYVVIGVFSKLGNAVKVLKKAKDQGHSASRIVNPKNGYHYIYVFYNAQEGPANEHRAKLDGAFEGVWVFTVK